VILDSEAQVKEIKLLVTQNGLLPFQKFMLEIFLKKMILILVDKWKYVEHGIMLEMKLLHTLKISKSQKIMISTMFLLNKKI
jgi:hypothetical protein